MCLPCQQDMKARKKNQNKEGQGLRRKMQCSGTFISNTELKPLQSIFFIPSQPLLEVLCKEKIA